MQKDEPGLVCHRSTMRIYNESCDFTYFKISQIGQRPKCWNPNFKIFRRKQKGRHCGKVGSATACEASIPWRCLSVSRLPCLLPSGASRQGVCVKAALPVSQRKVWEEKQSMRQVLGPVLPTWKTQITIWAVNQQMEGLCLSLSL